MATVEEDYEDRAFRQAGSDSGKTDAAYRSELATRKSNVEKAVNSNDGAKALALAIADPPYGASDDVKVCRTDGVR